MSKEEFHDDDCLHCNGYQDIIVIHCKECAEEIFSVAGKDTELAAIFIKGEMFMICGNCEHTRKYVWSGEDGAPAWDKSQTG